jgi:hypothetical protein
MKKLSCKPVQFTLWGLLAIVAASATSCALFAGPIAEKIASGVEKYCEEPLAYRQLYRNTINASLAHTGHLVHVHCSGDPTP